MIARARRVALPTVPVDAELSRALARSERKPSTTTLLPDETPTEYALELAGDCMEPLFKLGDKVLVSRDAPYQPGDLVVLFFRPDCIPSDGFQLQLKRLVLSTVGRTYWTDKNPKAGDLVPVVMFECINPAKRFQVHPDKLLGIHKALRRVPKGSTVRMSDDAIRILAEDERNAL